MFNIIQLKKYNNNYKYPFKRLINLNTMQRSKHRVGWRVIAISIGLMGIWNCQKKEESHPNPSRSIQEQLVMDDMLFGLRTQMDDFIIVDEARITGQVRHMGSRVDGTPCATVTESIETDSVRITIDFGTEYCTCADGTKRKGKLTLVYSNQQPYHKGYSRFIKRDQYAVNDYLVSGDTGFEFDYDDSTKQYRVHSIGHLSLWHLKRQQEITNLAGLYFSLIGGSETPNDVSDDRYSISQIDDFFAMTGALDQQLSYIFSIPDSLERQNFGPCRQHITKGRANILIFTDPNYGIDFGDGSCDSDVMYTSDGWKSVKTVKLP